MVFYLTLSFSEVCHWYCFFWPEKAHIVLGCRSINSRCKGEGGVRGTCYHVNKGD